MKIGLMEEFETFKIKFNTFIPNRDGSEEYKINVMIVCK